MFIQARIGLGKALTIVIIFTLGVVAAGYFWAGNDWLKTDNRNVYQFKTSLLEEQLRQNPDDISVKLDLAMTQYLEGKTGDSFRTYQSVLEQDPQNYHALFYMGLIKVDMKSYQDAIPLLEEVAAFEARFQPRLLYYNLGLAYFKTGNYKKAAQNLKVASKIEPGSYLVQYHLGMTYFKLGQFENAREPLEKAVRLGGNAGDAGKALETVNRLIKEQKLSKQKLSK